MDLYLESTVKNEKNINVGEIVIKQECTDDLTENNTYFLMGIEIDDLEIKYEEPNININTNNEYNAKVTNNNYIRNYCEQTVINKSQTCIKNLPGSYEELDNISNENIYKLLCNPQEYNITATNINNDNLKKQYLVHSDEKNSQCDPHKNTGFMSKICGKQITKLKKHKFIHTDEKHYKCNVCKKSFANKAGLKQHSLIHTGEKKYKCDICEKPFRQLSHLQQHHLIHACEKNYICDICEKAFTQLSHVQQHYLIHTGEKNYKCDICEKNFRQLSHLNKHSLFHTGKR